MLCVVTFQFIGRSEIVKTVIINIQKVQICTHIPSSFFERAYMVVISNVFWYKWQIEKVQF